MSALSSIGLSGLGAAQTALDASAHNIANAATTGFRREQVALATQAGAGVTAQVQRASQPGAALEADLVAQLVAKNQFLSNLAVFKASDRMMGSLLDATG